MLGPRSSFDMRQTLSIKPDRLVDLVFP